jgi:hypothetical protein
MPLDEETAAAQQIFNSFIYLFFLYFFKFSFKESSEKKIEKEKNEKNLVFVVVVAIIF